MKSKFQETPVKLKPFIALGFNYQDSQILGEEAYSDCVFCGSPKKLYVNVFSGLWECKSGKCARRGNLYSFMHYVYEELKQVQDIRIYQDPWRALVADRGMPRSALENSGIVWSGEQWLLPIRNREGALVNLKRYTLGQKLLGLPELGVGLYGAEQLGEDEDFNRPVFLCEGEWDAISLGHLFSEENLKAVAIAAPGSNTWKDSWSPWLDNRQVILCYDNDMAGLKGTQRMGEKLSARAAELSVIKWPETLKNGYDIRDFVSEGGTYDELKDLMSAYVSEIQENEARQAEIKLEPKLPLESRPYFEQVVKKFSEHLHMTTDMEIALRIIFAVVLSNQIEGDPLWVHIVSPPGTAKTELLMPLTGVQDCFFASTLTSHSLVSGFSSQGGGDPSLLPKLNGKTFILKDFTEILGMPKMQKDEIYSTLRGAYDGSVQKHFGNGLRRDYKIRFNMLSGVTHAIFGERGASLGERFLLFHLVKGVGFEAKDSIRAAIKNVGKEKEVRKGLQDTVRSFVGVKVEPELLPDITDEHIEKIIALSSMVAMLRANVDRIYTTGSTDKVMYRPQHEMGTRLGKQLTKLLYGLSLVNDPPSIGEREFKILSRVAMDTCVGFNLEAIAYLVKNPDGVFIEDLVENLNIPYTSMRDQLDDMHLLGAIRKEKVANPAGRGAPRVQYFSSAVINSYWEGAGLTELLKDKTGVAPSKLTGLRRNRRRK